MYCACTVPVHVVCQSAASSPFLPWYIRCTSLFCNTCIVFVLVPLAPSNNCCTNVTKSMVGEEVAEVDEVVVVVVGDEGESVVRLVKLPPCQPW